MMFLKKAWDWICKNWWAAVGLLGLAVGLFLGKDKAKEIFEAKSEFAKEEQEILEGASQEQREIAERYTDLIKRVAEENKVCLLYTSPSPRDRQKSRMPSSA